MILKYLIFLRSPLLVLLLWSSTVNAKLPELLLPEAGLQPDQLALVINTRDVLSWRIAEYYRKRHGIPPRNMIHIAFDPDALTIHPGEFAVMKKVLDAKTPPSIQAYLLTWAQPWRVGCMSITSAFALGFDVKYCASDCRPTALSEYARSSSRQPWTDLGVRPSMMLAAEDFAQARALINRGVLSKGWFFKGPIKAPAAYLVATPDKRRSVRKVYFPRIQAELGQRIEVHIEDTEGIQGVDDILFYFTGDRYVKGLYDNHYLPGAVADHLTSSGGQLTRSAQMSAIEWLKAGATGSYGTVVEPCNFLQKFPNPQRLMAAYLSGQTLMEAYWKSVAMPGQGVFIGDPLAAPFQGYRMVEAAGQIQVYTAQLAPGNYRLLASESPEGPFHIASGSIEIGRGLQTFVLRPPYARFYKLEPALNLELAPQDFAFPQAP